MCEAAGDEQLLSRCSIADVLGDFFLLHYQKGGNKREVYKEEKDSVCLLSVSL